jgi:hypothetical protein
MEYREAMRIEIVALEKQNTWISTLHPTNHCVLKSTWVFKLNDYQIEPLIVTKPDFVFVGTYKSQELISSKPTLQWCSGQQCTCN